MSVIGVLILFVDGSFVTPDLRKRLLGFHGVTCYRYVSNLGCRCRWDVEFVSVSINFKLNHAGAVKRLLRSFTVLLKLELNPVQECMSNLARTVVLITRYSKIEFAGHASLQISLLLKELSFQNYFIFHSVMQVLLNSRVFICILEIFGNPEVKERQ